MTINIQKIDFEETIIPDRIFNSGLDVYEFYLYSVLVYICKEKECELTNKMLKELCPFCVRKIMQVKKSLSSKGLIKITARKKEDGGQDSSLIEIMDLHVHVNRFTS